MQPYFFPYLGYFELMKEADVFVIFSEVQYIRRGWINRNRIRSKDKEFQFLTVPVMKSKQDTTINSMRIHESNWHLDHLKTISTTYPNSIKTETYKRYSKLPTSGMLVPFLMETLAMSQDWLGCKTPMISSEDFPCLNRGENRPTNRIIDICLQLGASTYLNLPGGVNLYSADVFKQHGLNLKFIEPKCENKLSILDSIFDPSQTALLEPSVAKESIATM